MRPSRSRARGGRIAGRAMLGTIAACLALGIASTTDAQEIRFSAGSHCGGGVVFGLASSGPDSPLGPELLTLVTGLGPSEPVSPAPPCSGPSCSRGAPAPLSAPAPPSTAPMSESWALWTSKHQSAPTLLGRTSAAEPAARPVHRPIGVFHPPR